MEQKRAKTKGRVALVLCGSLLALLGGELLTRAFDLDLRLMRKTLYYQCSYLPLHRTSGDARRLYELIPGMVVEGMPAATHPAEVKYRGQIDVSVNALGFRGKAFPPVKKKGTFRIVAFGGSNTFGSSVSDDDTYPAQLQKIFDEKCPGKVEVWNAGILAYVMSQNVAYAEAVVRKYDPDLVILQDTNRGRRAFRYDVTFKELKGLFRENRELFIENIPPLLQQDVAPGEKRRYFVNSTISGIHHKLVTASALYRAFCMGVYSSLGVFTYNKPIAPITEKYIPFWGYNGQIISNRDFDLFAKNHKHKKILLFFLNRFAHKIGRDSFRVGGNVAEYTLPSEGRPPEYQETHPPSYVYTWYAEELYNLLIEKGYLSGVCEEVRF